MKQQTFNISQKPLFLLKARLICLILGIKFNRKQYNKIVQEQINKGYEKYKRTILECPVDAYSWNIMALEEVVDALYYSNKNEQITRQTIKEKRLFSFNDIEILFKKWSENSNNPKGMFYKELHNELELSFKADKHFK